MHEKRAADLVVERDLLTSDHGRRLDVLPVWRRRLSTESPERLGSALMLVVRMLADTPDRGWLLRGPVAALLVKPFEVTDEDVLLAARTTVREWHDQNFVMLRIVEVMLRKRFGPTIADPAALTTARELVDLLARNPGPDADRSRIRARIQQLLPDHVQPAVSVIVRVDGWAKDVLPRLTDASDGTSATGALLRQLTLATGSKPGKGWAAKTGEMVADPATRAALRVLVERLVEAGTVPREHWGQPMRLLLDERNADLVRAAIWATVPVAEPWVVPALLGVVQRAFDVPNGWIMSPKVANAAIFALGQTGGVEAITALSILDTKAPGNDYRKRIATAVATAGEAVGLSPGQVLERMVDTGGLGTDGTVELTRGSVTARATLNADLSITIAWPGTTGWVTKPPAGADKATVDAIKRQVRDLRGLVATERRRVEGLFAEDRDWDLAEWRRYYLDHPITGRIAARLLWRFGEEVRLGGAADPPPEGRVRLWHPAGATTAEVAWWRDFQLEQDLRQPFKQAFREVYLRTDAERETRLYSNRFAAHVLRYGQAYALFKERGWVANYLGPYDGGGAGRARREFRDAGLTAVFEHFPADEGDRLGGPDLCTTDRVWFHRTAGQARTPIPVEEVPPLVFSEAMRDVDLFVGVASIALDPLWVDHGDHPHYPYWTRVSFGELSARAEVRRDALARILPKLAVADRVELDGRFVRVRGTRAVYRIHLGSANIMIEPDDRYLCIVPGRGKGPKVLLPFEGDAVLSVILSKVALLAADDKITDPIILNQLTAR